MAKAQKKRPLTYKDKPLSEIITMIPGYDPWRDADGWWFDEQIAFDRIDFIVKCCTHVEGDLSGKPFVLELWQAAIVANLFGWQGIDEKGRQVRRYRQLFLYVPRKNGKTPLTASLANCVFFMDGEKGMQGYCAAGSRKQATLLFRWIEGQIKNEPHMLSRVQIYTATKTITKTDDNSFIEVVSADGNLQHGQNTHLAIIDELHVQPSPILVDTLESSMVSLNRPQPLLIFLTTADVDRPSVCNTKHKYAKDVRDGVVLDARCLPVIYETDPEKADAIYETEDGIKFGWELPEVWANANPNLGVSVSQSAIQTEVNKAKASPSEVLKVKRLHLNIKTGVVSQWLDMGTWNACTEATDAIKWRERMLAELKGETCDAAIDLGSTSDLTALALLFRRDTGYIWLPFFWVPKIGAQKKEKEHRVPYLTWAQQGFITLTAGSVTDYKYVRSDIVKLVQDYPFRLNAESGKPEIAVDRVLLGIQFCTDIADEDGLEPVAFGQGFMSMAAPTKEFEELVIDGRIDHGANPVLYWMASNVAVKTDPAGNMKAVKPDRIDAAKIDGIVAGIMALGRSMVSNDDTCVYDTRGVLTV